MSLPHFQRPLLAISRRRICRIAELFLVLVTFDNVLYFALFPYIELYSVTHFCCPVFCQCQSSDWLWRALAKRP